MPIDYKKYPKNWKTEIVPAVLNRCGYKCECCGLPNRSFVYSVTFLIKRHRKYVRRAIWFSSRWDAIREAGGEDFVKKVEVILTVAHLDHDAHNHNVSLDRLKALCQICHLRYDALEKYVNKRIDPENG